MVSQKRSSSGDFSVAPIGHSLPYGTYSIDRLSWLMSPHTLLPDAAHIPVLLQSGTYRLGDEESI